MVLFGSCLGALINLLIIHNYTVNSELMMIWLDGIIVLFRILCGRDEGWLTVSKFEFKFKLSYSYKPIMQF